MKKRRQRGKPYPEKEVHPELAIEPVPQADGDEGVEGETPGEALESRSRNPRDERLGRDALDDREPLRPPPVDVPFDAVDEIIASPSPDEYITTDSGDRKPDRDEAEMGFGAEPHSVDDLVDRALGDAIPGKRGRTREGEKHGRDLGR